MKGLYYYIIHIADLNKNPALIDYFPFIDYNATFKTFLAF